MTTKQHYTARDRLAAHLVLLVIFCMFIIGAIALYMTGVFSPVNSAVSFAETEPLELNVPPAPGGQSGFLRWLIPSAMAEDTDLLQDETEIEQLFSQMLEEEAETEIDESDRISVDKKDLAINANLPGNWFNVLLLATDSRDMKAEPGRTDVMIVASINAETGEIKLTSFARDLYVPIPGIAAPNRLNAAFAYGRANLAMKTINHNFGLNIENYVLVNFSIMVSIVDMLGGVDIPISEPRGSGRQEYEVINEIVAVMQDFEGFSKSPSRRLLTESDMGTTVRLDGLQAVAFARVRKTDDDIHRGSRQRILLQTLLEKVMQDASLSSLITLFNTISPITETNLSVPQIIEMASKLLLADSMELSEMAVPIAGSYRPSDEVDGKGKKISVLSFSTQTNVEAVHEFIYGEYIAPTVK